MEESTSRITIPCLRSSRRMSNVILIILLDILLFISEPEPAQDPLCEEIDPLTLIDVIEIPIPADTSTNTSPAKSDVEHSNIVSSTATGM